VVPAGGSNRDDQLLPGLGANLAQARRRAASPNRNATLVIWGQRDRYLGEELAEPDHDDVPNLDRVERLADASHWVHHDEPERVTRLLIDFFTPTPPTKHR
jgi:pimeloyl-ACP methyl ester carboxylesterase